MSNDYLSARVADIIAPDVMHILCIALRYNKPNKSKNQKVSYVFITFL